MSAPYNLFSDNLEQALVTIVQAYLTAQSSTAVVTAGESSATDLNPHVIVAVASAVESVYLSGIYEDVIDFTARVNIDDTNSYVSTSKDSVQSLFASILDVVQQPSLIDQLNHVGSFIVRGIVPGDQRLNSLSERQWEKSISVSFFGFMTT